MNAALKSVVLVTTFAALLGVAPLAQAAPPQIQLRLSTGGGSPYLRPAPSPAPQLGFYGHFEWGTGMVVDSVPWGTPARQMGLEAGDTIVAINGYWLQSQNDYYRALQYSGGLIRVTVQDIRTGRLATRVANLDGGGYYSSGPVAYGSRPSLSIQLH